MIVFLLFLPRRPGIRITCLFRYVIWVGEREQMASIRYSLFVAKRLSFHLNTELYGTPKGIQFPACLKDEIIKLWGVPSGPKTGGRWQAHMASKHPSWWAFNDVTPKCGWRLSPNGRTYRIFSFSFSFALNFYNEQVITPTEKKLQLIFVVSGC